MKTRFVAVLSGLFLAAGLFALPVRALETAVIPVEVRLTAAENRHTFTVELLPEDRGNPMPAGSENGKFRMEVAANTERSFRIPCDRAGIFAYTLRQLPEEDPLLRCDDRVYDLTVYATWSESGALDVSAVLDGQDGEKPDRALFTNGYLGPVSVTLTAVKTLDGGTPKNGAFFFRLLDETGSLVFETENQGRAVAFPALRFDTPGTYRYYLKETAGDAEGIVYDRAVYTAVVEVTRTDGLTASVTWERNGKPYTGIPEFYNYTEGASPKTGDGIGIYAITLILSGAALAGTAAYGCRKRRR